MNCEVCGIDYGLYIMPYQPVGDVTVCGPCAARVQARVGESACHGADQSRPDCIGQVSAVREPCRQHLPPLNTTGKPNLCKMNSNYCRFKSDS